jgi:uncharacterized coiled-coil protein SlyX
MVKATPKTDKTPMVSVTVFNALLARVDALEAENTKLTQDVSVLKKIPADLTVLQSIIERHTDRMDHLAERITAVPVPKPKRWLGIL